MPARAAIVVFVVGVIVAAAIRVAEIEVWRGRLTEFFLPRMP